MFGRKEPYKEFSQDPKEVHKRLDNVERRVEMLEKQKQVYTRGKNVSGG